MGENFGAVDMYGQGGGRGDLGDSYELRGVGGEGAEHVEVGSVVGLTPFLTLLF